MPKIVIIGAGGRLGSALVRAYTREFEVLGLSRAELELGKLDDIPELLSGIEFDLLINCAALTAVDYCESHSEEAFRVNTEAPRLLAQLCRQKSAKLIHFSTDYVFDGRHDQPYHEEDEALPLTVYGESKLEGERAVLQVSDRFLVVRVSWVFGPDRPSFIDQVIERARHNSEVTAVADKYSTPTYTIDIAQWLRVAWQKDVSEILHLANEGVCSWQEYAQHALDCCRAVGMGLKTTRVAPASLAEMTNFIARRPVYTVLSCQRFASVCGVQPRSWREAVAEYVRNHVTLKQT